MSKCKNILSFSFLFPYENLNEEKKIINEIHSEFRKIFLDIEVEFLNPQEIVGYSNSVTPLQELENLVNKYKIDIIGVAYKFSEGYTESINLEYLEEEIEEEEIEENLLNENVDIGEIELTDNSILK